MALRELHVSELAVIRQARLEPGPGFSVLTGETGAGKSVCVSALRAALGGKVDSDVVRHGADAARVRAVFDNIQPALAARLEELGLPRDELLTLTREVSAGGRGSARINGALVSQSVLREVGEALADVTAQGASQRLLQRQWQRDLLDAYGGSATREARGVARDAVRAWRAALAEVAAAAEAARRDASEVSRARDTVEDLERLELRTGEEAELRAECLRLRHAGRIRNAADGLAEATGGEGRGADLVAAALAEASAVAPLDQAVASLVEETADLVERLREVGLDARRLAANLNVDDSRLALVEDRLDAIARVERRHGSVENALAALDAARETVAAADGGQGRVAALEAKAADAARVAADACAGLTRSRAAAARRLEPGVSDELRRLELPQARFRVTLGHSPDPAGLDLGDGIPLRCGVSGVDEIEFRLATNRDMLPMPLAEGPSGGELSRLALALSAVVGEADPVLLVLDEVDSGIGGETAARVGDVLAGIGEHRQVLAITHRPEIAARAQTHLVVARTAGAAGAADAAVNTVAGDDRAVEIARLMSGRVTRAALDRAVELLGEGRVGRRPRSRRAISTM